MSVPVDIEQARKWRETKEREDRRRITIMSKFIWGRRTLTARVWRLLIGLMIIMGIGFWLSHVLFE